MLLKIFKISLVVLIGVNTGFLVFGILTLTLELLMLAILLISIACGTISLLLIQASETELAEIEFVLRITETGEGVQNGGENELEN